jgi:hypothetical protein
MARSGIDFEPAIRLQAIVQFRVSRIGQKSKLTKVSCPIGPLFPAHSVDQ